MASRVALPPLFPLDPSFPVTRSPPAATSAANREPEKLTALAYSHIVAHNIPQMSDFSRDGRSAELRAKGLLMHARQRYGRCHGSSVAGAAVDFEDTAERRV